MKKKITIQRVKEIILWLVIILCLLVLSSCSGWNWSTGSYDSYSTYDPYRYQYLDCRYPYYNRYNIWVDFIYTPYNYNRYGYYPYNSYRTYNYYYSKPVPKQETYYAPGRGPTKSSSDVKKPTDYKTRRNSTVYTPSGGRTKTVQPTRSKTRSTVKSTPTRTRTRTVQPTPKRAPVKKAPVKRTPVKKKQRKQ